MAAAQTQDKTDWFAAQQEHWEQLFQTQQARWTDLLGQWQAGNAVPGADSFQKYFAQGGQQFLDMMQKFQQSAAEGKTADAAAADWTAGLKDFFGRIVQAQEAAETYKNFLSLGENMVKAGQAWASAFQDKRTFSQGFANYDPFGFFASMPGIGYTREKQEEYARLYRLWHDYEAAMKKYNAAMAGVGLEAAQKFQEYVVSPPKDATPLKSLKDVYVKWVDICEEVYAKYAVTKEYTDLYGETVNALMAYKKQFNKLTDGMMDELNLPTRKEVDALHERLHDLRREVIALRKELAGGKRKPAPKAAAAPAPKPAKAAAPAKKKAKKK